MYRQRASYCTGCQTPKVNKTKVRPKGASRKHASVWLRGDELQGAGFRTGKGMAFLPVDESEEAKSIFLPWANEVTEGEWVCLVRDVCYHAVP